MKVLLAGASGVLGRAVDGLGFDAAVHAAVMSAGTTLSNEKARRELGWAPAVPGAREAVECLAGRDLAVRG